MGIRRFILSLLLACAPAAAQVGPSDPEIQQVPLEKPAQAPPDLPDPSEVLEAPVDDEQQDSQQDSPPDAQQSVGRGIANPRLKLDSSFSSMEALPPPRKDSTQ